MPSGGPAGLEESPRPTSAGGFAGTTRQQGLALRRDPTIGRIHRVRVSKHADRFA
jgi:hypothetical protein